MINKRTDALKTDGNYNNKDKLRVDLALIEKARALHLTSFLLSVLLLTIKISQWARENFAVIVKNYFVVLWVPVEYSSFDHFPNELDHDMRMLRQASNDHLSAIVAVYSTASLIILYNNNNYFIHTVCMSLANYTGPQIAKAPSGYVIPLSEDNSDLARFRSSRDL